MKTSIIKYWNQTGAPVKIKKRSGLVIAVPSGAGEETEKSDPFVKVKYFATGWRKL